MAKKYPKTVILRSRRENIKKCSLKGLANREDFLFLTYPQDNIPNLTGYIILTLDAPPITNLDADRCLFILDGTWRISEKMMKFVLGEGVDFQFRSIPRTWKTAYPRRQPDCLMPEFGLASLEAIYAAYKIFGRDTTGLLDHYYWKNEFLNLNNALDI